MVLLKPSQRHNSDLDCAAGQEKFRDFILISDENFVAISPLYCVTQHPSLIWQSLLWKGRRPGTVKDISTKNSSALGSMVELSVFCPYYCKLGFFLLASLLYHLLKVIELAP